MGTQSLESDNLYDQKPSSPVIAHLPPLPPFPLHYLTPLPPNHITKQLNTTQHNTTQHLTQSQGMTIPLLEVSFNGMFEYGQGYVALSRATDLEGLTLQNFEPKR